MGQQKQQKGTGLLRADASFSDGRLLQSSLLTQGPQKSTMGQSAWLIQRATMARTTVGKIRSG